MAEILLTKGLKTLVDDNLYEYLSKYKWYAQKTGYKTFVARNKHLLMHRLIMNVTPDKEIDHVNGNTLDNRINNLRVCSHSQNMLNRHKFNIKNTTSIFKGVHFRYCNNKYCARIGFNNKRIVIGCFENEVDAAIAYDLKAKELFGDFALLNFKE
jgi:hypothetical protein